MNIQDWLIKNKIQFKIVDEIIINIEEVGDFLLIKEKEIEYYQEKTKKSKQVIFDENFNILLNKEEQKIIKIYDIQGVIYEFGGKFYYDKISDLKNPKLNLLKYLGKCKQELDFDFVPLGVHGKYEILNGSRDYIHWCNKNIFYNYKSLGICEKNTLAGTLQFQLECDNLGLKSILGETINIKRGDIIFEGKVYCLNEKGWENLLLINKEINVVNLEERCIKEEDLLKLGEGLVFIFLSVQNLTYSSYQVYLKSFNRIYFQIDSIIWKNNKKDKEYLLEFKEYIEKYSKHIKPILINDAYYLDEEDASIKTFLNKLNNVGFVNNSTNQYFKNVDDNYLILNKLFKDEDYFYEFFEKIINNTIELANLVEFKIQTKKFHLPQFELKDLPEKYLKVSSNEELFLNLINEGLEIKGKDISDEEFDIWIKRINEELELIKLGDFIDYFLILWDIIRWCKEKGILTGIGRGSSGGSLISYLLDITKINPIEFGLLFERFLSKDRIGKSFPDIDVDFPSQRRDEVKKYMEERYGEGYVCSIGTYTTLQIKQAIKDLSKKKGIEFSKINYLNNCLKLKTGNWSDLFDDALNHSFVYNFVQENIDIINDIPLCLNQPKASSIHPCATVILPKEEGKNIFNTLPVKMEDGILVSEWEGNEIANAGYLKEDILGIKQLDKFQFILNLIKETTGEEIDIYSINTKDKKVFELFKKGYNSDIFHFGSFLLSAYSKETQPETLEDLIAMISLVRPGAMQSGANHDYINLKKEIKRPIYDFKLREVTEQTYGLYIYQEQIMKAVQVLGGFEASETNAVLKAMGKLRRDILEPYERKFIDGAIKNGCKEDEAQKIWDKLVGFADYGFNKCISGEETIYRIIPKSSFSPTIGEMWKIKNDRAYAESIGKYPLYYRYNTFGYGSGFSLNEKNRLIKNKIKDIRYIGVKSLYRMILENGESINITLNHKFPTNNGEKILADIDINKDQIYFKVGYEKEDTEIRWGDERKNWSEGKLGFQPTGDTPHNLFLRYREQLKEDFDKCQICNLSHNRLEIHHKDGIHINSDFENLIILCPSCHKKEHYKLGRIKQGEKGLLTKLVKIKSIKYLKEAEVFDVEMENPYHSFSIKNGIITSNSHAAAYSKMGYIGQWLKANYPIQFWTAALQFEEKEENINRYIAEIKKIDDYIKIVPPDINKSNKTFYTDFKEGKIYFSLESIYCVGEVAINEIIRKRELGGEYFSLKDFLNRIDKAYVDKGIIENLILSGSFDTTCEIKHISERINILKEFYEIRNIKEKDQNAWYLEMIKKNYKEEFEFLLKQKELSGLGEFDFKALLKQSKLKHLLNIYCNETDFFDIEKENQRVIIGGIIIDIKERASKKGTFAQIEIDNNYEKINITYWAKMWEKDKKYFTEDKIGKILLISGRIVSYKNTNSLQIEDDVEYQIL